MFIQANCYTHHLICSVIRLNSLSGAMTRPQPPTCCYCKRRRGANLSASSRSHEAATTPAPLCTTERRSVSNLLCLGLFPMNPAGVCCVYVAFHRLHRRGTSSTSARTRMPSSWDLWTCAQITLTIARGCRSRPTHPRVSEDTRMDPVAKTWWETLQMF